MIFVDKALGKTPWYTQQIIMLPQPTGARFFNLSMSGIDLLKVPNKSRLVEPEGSPFDILQII